jgi:hypothetical protein
VVYVWSLHKIKKKSWSNQGKSLEGICASNQLPSIATSVKAPVGGILSNTWRRLIVAAALISHWNEKRKPCWRMWGELAWPPRHCWRDQTVFPHSCPWLADVIFPSQLLQTSFPLCASICSTALHLSSGKQPPPPTCTLIFHTFYCIVCCCCIF